MRIPFIPQQFGCSASGAMERALCKQLALAMLHHHRVSSKSTDQFRKNEILLAKGSNSID